MKKKRLEERQEFTIFSDYEVTKNDSLNMHKQWTPTEVA